jgi:hypothetical protein
VSQPFDALIDIAPYKPGSQAVCRDTRRSCRTPSEEGENKNENILGNRTATISAPGSGNFCASYY